MSENKKNNNSDKTFKNMNFINISDLKNPKTGKTHKQENNEKTHKIPLGTLVEVDFNDEHCESPKKGLRLFVVRHDRDCDGTPLYSLSFNKDWKEEPNQYIPLIAFRMQIDTGYSEGSLKVVDR